MQFEWDENKNKINQRKHGISFDEVTSVFRDAFAIVFDDPDHSENVIFTKRESERRLCYERRI